MKPIDIFIGCYLRAKYTEKTLEYLIKRTNYPYRLFLLINGEDEGNNFIARTKFKDHVFMIVNFSKNGGVHMLWNTALALAESEYFITSDNDVLVPDLRESNDWLEKMVDFMDLYGGYGAISLHPHVFIGAASVNPEDPENVKERNMCGAVMRIMRRKAVLEAGGWERKIEEGRNHEERTICSRLQDKGWKTGVASKVRAFHMFGDNWGYPKEFTPEMQKHNPELKDYVNQFNNMEAYDNKTWFSK